MGGEQAKHGEDNFGGRGVRGVMVRGYSEIMSDTSQYKDYKISIKNFVSHELKSELDSFQTISGDDDGKMLLVTTSDNNAYKVLLKKNKDDIWQVSAYSEL